MTLRLIIALTFVACFTRAADLPYARRATREETRRATLAALQQQLGAGDVSQSPWQLLGPFDNPRNGGLDLPYPPEKSIDLAAEYTGLNGAKIRWHDAARFADGRIHNLDIFGPKNWLLCYLHRTITATKDMPATLFVGSDDSVTLWLNGKKVHDKRDSRPTVIDSDIVPVQLNQGTNSLLMKIGQFQGNYSFAYRLSVIPGDLLTKLDEKLDEDFPTGEAAFYRLETIAIPQDIRLEVGGMAFMPDGHLMICTRRGEVWSFAPKAGQWKRFASGLHEPLGVLALGPGEIAVAQRPELTRLKDTDGDGEADLFATMNANFGVSGNYHEYHFGPVRDQQGNLYATLNLAWEGEGTAPVPLRGTAYQLTPDGRFSVWSTGLRSPAGIGVSPGGDVFITDNQGDWWGTSPLLHAQSGTFFGHPASMRWIPGYNGPPNPRDIPPERLAPLRKLPAAWFVINKLGRSPGEPVWDTTTGRFGPFAGQMFVGDQTKSFIMRVALEKVGGEFQGAIFPFRAGFASGIIRMAYDADGALWVGGTDRGWGAVGGRPYALQKLTWTGRVPFEIHTMKLTKTGFDLTFTKPVDAASATSPSNYSFQSYHYNYWRNYGSNEEDVRPVKVTGVKLSPDGKTVSVTLAELPAQKIYELHIKGLKATDGSDLAHGDAYYTLNRQ
ncbi:MAG: hypothetical protein AB1705_02420 [Verrucomicrobiota bacterium]